MATRTMFENRDGNVFSWQEDAPQAPAAAAPKPQVSLFEMATKTVPQMFAQAERELLAGETEIGNRLIAEAEGHIEANRGRLEKVLAYTGRAPMMLAARPAAEKMLKFEWTRDPQMNALRDPRTNPMAAQAVARKEFAPGTIGYGLAIERHNGSAEAASTLAIFAGAPGRGGGRSAKEQASPVDRIVDLENGLKYHQMAAPILLDGIDPETRKSMAAGTVASMTSTLYGHDKNGTLARLASGMSNASLNANSTAEDRIGSLVDSTKALAAVVTTGTRAFGGSPTARDTALAATEALAEMFPGRKFIGRVDRFGPVVADVVKREADAMNYGGTALDAAGVKRLTRVLAAEAESDPSLLSEDPVEAKLASDVRWLKAASVTVTPPMPLTPKETESTIKGVTTDPDTGKVVAATRDFGLLQQMVVGELQAVPVVMAGNPDLNVKDALMQRSTTLGRSLSDTFNLPPETAAAVAKVALILLGETGQLDVGTLDTELLKDKDVQAMLADERAAAMKSTKVEPPARVAVAMEDARARFAPDTGDRKIFDAAAASDSSKGDLRPGFKAIHDFRGVTRDTLTPVIAKAINGADQSIAKDIQALPVSEFATPEGRQTAAARLARGFVTRLRATPGLTTAMSERASLSETGALEIITPVIREALQNVAEAVGGFPPDSTEKLSERFPGGRPEGEMALNGAKIAVTEAFVTAIVGKAIGDTAVESRIVPRAGSAVRPLADKFPVEENFPSWLENPADNLSVRGALSTAGVTDPAERLRRFARESFIPALAPAVAVAAPAAVDVSARGPGSVAAIAPPAQAPGALAARLSFVGVPLKDALAASRVISRRIVDRPLTDTLRAMLARDGAGEQAMLRDGVSRAAIDKIRNDAYGLWYAPGAAPNPSSFLDKVRVQMDEAIVAARATRALAEVTQRAAIATELNKLKTPGGSSLGAGGKRAENLEDKTTVSEGEQP